MDRVLSRLEQLNLLRDVDEDRGTERARDAGHAPAHHALLWLCDEGALMGGLSVALDVRPDELVGTLCVSIGGRARAVKVVDVREKPAFELTLSLGDVTERWQVDGIRALAHNFNDLLRDDPEAAIVVVLGKWQDALHLWCVPKHRARELLKERFFAPENIAEVKAILAGAHS
jgi:hypothetical protein